MWTAGRTAKKVFKRPGAFALAVIKQFRANQGVLLAGAVAYYTLLSLVPLLILILMALSHIVPEDRLLLTLSEYLEFVVPGQSAALVEEVRTFLAQKQVVGGFLFVTMLFFSALAFAILENAMSVIFFHRVKIKRRHFLVSAVMRYLFIVGVTGEIFLLTAIYFVMPVGRLSLRHALIGGVTATLLWEMMRHILAWYYTTMSQIQLVYGSLTTAIAVLLSVEIGALVLLVGAQVIAEYERISREPSETSVDDEAGTTR